MFAVDFPLQHSDCIVIKHIIIGISCCLKLANCVTELLGRTTEKATRVVSTLDEEGSCSDPVRIKVLMQAHHYNQHSYLHQGCYVLVQSGVSCQSPGVDGSHIFVTVLPKYVN